MGSILGCFGVNLGVFDTIPIRARAYNDCAQDAVLLKTASKWGYPGPQNGPILGSSDGHLHTDTHYMRISLYLIHIQIHAIIYPPKMGPFWGTSTGGSLNHGSVAGSPDLGVIQG